jgi:hypothetical protein
MGGFFLMPLLYTCYKDITSIQPFTYDAKKAYA